MAKNRLWCRLALVVPLWLAASAAFAQSDPPGRVGRLSYMEGTVSFHGPDPDQWSPATLNYPVVAGASFWTEPGARAEIQVGAAEFRLDQTTLLDVVALDDAATRLQLDQGVLNVHLQVAPSGGVEVMTPLGVIDLVGPGSYHIDAGHGDPSTPPERVEVTVLDGRAEASGPRHRIEILEGERAILAGDPVSITLAEGGATSFDDWALERERREQAIAAAQYVSPGVTGYQDLDDYGQWGNDPNYGAVWYPTGVPADWAPYRYGHWAWIQPWGWTWIDDSPWGFAPFHYGRWAEIDGRWGWCPGVVVARPVYAPALVAFIGGGGWSVSIASGPALPAVGWVPLAPFEVYHPYYRTSVTYVRQVNITNVREIEIRRTERPREGEREERAERYANHRAATVVPSEAFTHAAPVHRASLAIHEDELRRAQVTPSVANLRPTPTARAGVAAPHAAETIVPHPNLPATVARSPAASPQPHRDQHEELPPRAPGPSFAGRPVRPMPAVVHPPQQPTNAPRIDAQPGRTPGAPPHPAAPPAQVQIIRPTPPVAPHIEAQPGRTPDAAQHPATPPAQVQITRPAAPAAPHVEAQPGRTPDAAPHPATPPAQVQIVRPAPPAAPHIEAAPTRAQGAAPPRPVAAPTLQMARPSPPATPPTQARPPMVQIERPVQQTRLAPTPQGWQRAPQPPAAAAPAPHPAPHPAPAQDHNEHKPGG